MAARALPNRRSSERNVTGPTFSLRINRSRSSRSLSVRVAVPEAMVGAP
jgi:hypothetical protein